jgi:hypothetical protein
MIKSNVILAKLVATGQYELAAQVAHVMYGGVVQYPQHMYKEIRVWVMQVYGSWVAERAERMVKILGREKERLPRRIERDFGGDAEKLKKDSALFDQQISEYAGVVAAATKLTGNKRLTKLIRRTTKTFKIDLAGLGAGGKYPVDKMTSLTDCIPVIVNMDTANNKTTKAYWTAYPAVSRKLVMFISEDAIDVRKAWSLNFYVSKIEQSLQHELQHMVQTLIGDTLEDPDTRIKENKLENVPEKYKYWLDPDEFHTWILGSKNDFLNEVMATRPEFWAGPNPAITIDDVRPTREEFNRFVGNPKPVDGQGKTGPQAISTAKFFRVLHEYDHDRWKLAMREFYKIVSPLLAKSS